MSGKYGEWAMITGASSGIGAEFAKRLAVEKYNLILVARREERLNSVAKLLAEREGIEVKVLPGDLTDLNFIEKLKTECAGYEIGLLINNAGFGSTGEFINCDAERECKMVMLNCVAPTLLTHYFTKGMIDRKKGGVIFLGSMVAFQSTPMMASYAATKAFNLLLGEALWYELKKYNIDVLALNPGGTNTEFQRIASLGAGPKPRTPEQVVETALIAIGRKPSVVDGALNKIMAVLGKFLPRRSLVVVAGKVSEKLYNAKGK